MGHDGRVLERDPALLLEAAERLQRVKRLLLRIEAEDDELAHGNLRSGPRSGRRSAYCARRAAHQPGNRPCQCVYSRPVEPWEFVRAILIVVAAYVIGGIPWGVVVARVAGGPGPRALRRGRPGGSQVHPALGPRAA